MPQEHEKARPRPGFYSTRSPTYGGFATPEIGVRSSYIKLGVSRLDHRSGAIRDRSVIQWAHTADTVDRGPGKLPNTSSRLIAMAVSLVGEAQSVVLEMKCSPHDFRDYCAGLKEPPPDQFERLVALIIHEQGKMIAKNRELIAKNRELIAQCRGLTAKFRNDN